MLVIKIVTFKGGQCDKGDFPYYEELLNKGKNLLPCGSEFFPLREVLILKRDAIEENHCLIK